MEHADANLTANFEVLGQPVRLETNSLHVVDAAQSLLGPERERDPKTRPINLRLVVHEVPEAIEWRADHQAVFRANGSLFYVAASRASVIVGDRDTKSAFGFISTHQAANLEHLRSALIQAAVLWIAGSHVLSPVHAAAVEVNGRSIMIRGEAGAGKTTLAFALAHHGARLIADDAVFIDVNGDDLVIRGLPWLVYLTPDSTQFFSGLSNMPVVTRFNGEEKLAIATRQLSGIQTAQFGELGPTLVVRQSQSARNTLTRLSEEEARCALTETSIAVERSVANGIDIWMPMIKAGVYRFDMATEPLCAAYELIDLLLRIDRLHDEM